MNFFDIFNGISVTVGDTTYQDIFTTIGEVLDNLTSDIDINLDDF